VDENVDPARRTLLSDRHLEQASVVANSTMNRGRGLAGVNSYARELGLDPVSRLRGMPAGYAWLDLCSGEGRALREAAPALAPDAVLTGVDLVGPLTTGAPPALPANVELVTASLTEWSPNRSYDLITCVHGLHYLGDKLGLLTRAAGWLSPFGRLVAHLDPESLRLHDGRSAARPVLRALRAVGFRYDSRRHLLSLDGDRTVSLPFTYLGADPASGPNYTGQPAVASYYRTNSPGWGQSRV
jgi:SAM-dependent methyltransferase